MRPSILALAAVAALSIAPAAHAAPTCQDKNGGTIRCGTPGAMPVGWTLPPDQILDTHPPSPMGPSPNELFELICIIGGFFALIALMPEFDGTRAGDWDEQEGDGEERE